MEKRFAIALLLGILVIAGVPAAAVAVLSLAPSVSIVCTPPPCSSGTYTCPPAGNGCPGGCGVVCVTPTTPPSAGEPLIIIGGLALCLLALKRKSG